MTDFDYLPTSMLNQLENYEQWFYLVHVLGELEFKALFDRALGCTHVTQLQIGLLCLILNRGDFLSIGNAFQKVSADWFSSASWTARLLFSGETISYPIDLYPARRRAYIFAKTGISKST